MQKNSKSVSRIDKTRANNSKSEGRIQKTTRKRVQKAAESLKPLHIAANHKRRRRRRRKEFGSRSPSVEQDPSLTRSRSFASPARTHDRTESDFLSGGSLKAVTLPQSSNFFNASSGPLLCYALGFATPPLVCSALLGLLCAPWFAKPPSFATPTLGACVPLGLPHLPWFGAIPRRMQLPLPTRICLHLSLSADRNGPA